MQEIRVRSLDQEDSLEKGMATHSSILAWRIPWTEEAGGLQSMGSQRVTQDRATKCTHTEALNAFEEFLSLILNKSSMKTGILALFMGIAQVPSSVSLCWVSEQMNESFEPPRQRWASPRWKNSQGVSLTSYTTSLRWARVFVKGRVILHACWQPPLL